MAQQSPSPAPDALQKSLRDARAALEAGDTVRAERHCRSALAANPRHAEALTLLGISLRSREPEAAAEALVQAAASDPSSPDIQFHLGNVYREAGRWTAAAAAYERALEGAPGHLSILNNLGLVLHRTGQVDKAEAAYAQVLERNPTHRQALANLAHLLCGIHRYDECDRLCRRYLHAYPAGEAGVWVNHGICLRQQGNLGDAETAFMRAMALAPDDSLIISNVGSLRLDRNDPAGAEPMLESALAVDAANTYTLGLLAFCRQALCKWQELAEMHREIAHRLTADALYSAEAPSPFTALALPLPANVQRHVAERWAAGFATLTPPNIGSKRSAVKPQRLGYVSSDFLTHPIAYLLTEVWERHDRTRFETFAYSIGPRESSTLRTRIETAFDHFTDCSDESFAQTAARIRHDRIDVLIDLNGYTRNARTELMALRPAPTQIGWLGFLGTSGAPFMDYYIADSFCAPDAGWFSERLILLPDCYCPSDTRRQVAFPTPSRHECALPENAFVFCCFNNNYKILPAMFDVWMRLLARIASSVLWLSVENDDVMMRLRTEAQGRGVDPDRLIFAPRVPADRHLARISRADLFLDTLPYNAGTTANDALLMGVPVLTCAGDTMAGRVAGSQLRAAGLSDLVTRDLAAYEALAFSIATDKAKAIELRTRVSQARSMPLFDMARFTNALEDQLTSVAAGDHQLGRASR